MVWMQKSVVWVKKFLANLMHSWQVQTYMMQIVQELQIWVGGWVGGWCIDLGSNWPNGCVGGINILEIWYCSFFRYLGCTKWNKFVINVWYDLLCSLFFGFSTKWNIRVVQRVFFWKKNVQRLPYFERNKVRNCHIWTLWLIPLVDKIGGKNLNPGHNVAKEIKILNCKESLKNNKFASFFFFHYFGKIEVTWVTYLTFAFVMTCVTLTFLWGFCFFSFCKEDVWRGLKSWKFFCHHDVFFSGTMLSRNQKKKKGCEVYGKQRIQGCSSDVFWATVMWAVVLSSEWQGLV
jgi:hypothetical protein